MVVERQITLIEYYGLALEDGGEALGEYEVS